MVFALTHIGGKLVPHWVDRGAAALHCPPVRRAPHRAPSCGRGALPITVDGSNHGRAIQMASSRQQSRIVPVTRITSNANRCGRATRARGHHHLHQHIARVCGSVARFPSGLVWAVSARSLRAAIRDLYPQFCRIDCRRFARRTGAFVTRSIKCLLNIMTVVSALLITQAAASQQQKKAEILGILGRFRNSLRTVFNRPQESRGAAPASLCAADGVPGPRRRRECDAWQFVRPARWQVLVRCRRRAP